MMKNVANKSHHFLLEKTPSRNTNEKKCAVVKKSKWSTPILAAKAIILRHVRKKKLQKHSTVLVDFHA